MASGELPGEKAHASLAWLPAAATTSTPKSSCMSRMAAFIVADTGPAIDSDTTAGRSPWSRTHSSPSSTSCAGGFRKRRGRGRASRRQDVRA